MSKNIRIIYLYLVSFIALGMIVIGFITTVNSVSSYFFPIVNYYSYYGEDSYNYDEEIAIRTRNAKKESIKNAISSFTVIAIGTPLFIYHWKKIQIERKEEV